MSIYSNLHKRLQNVRSPQKKQGPTLERAIQKKGVALASQQVTMEKMMQTQVVDQPLFFIKHLGAVLMMATLHVSGNITFWQYGWAIF